MTAHPAHLWALSLVLVATTAGCASAPGTLEPLDRLGGPGKTWASWLEGAPTAEAQEAFRAQSADPVGRFGAAETAYVLGRYEEAWDYHAELVAQDPNHPLARWSVLRLLELTGTTPGQRSRTQYLRSRLRAPASDDDVTNVLLGLLTISEDDDAPLAVWRTAGPFGTSPIGDLKRRFEPDGRATIAREPPRTRPELAAVRDLRDPVDVTRLEMPLTRAGTYYAETEFTSDRKGRWVLYLELPHDTTVFLDGVEILRRDVLDGGDPEQFLVRLDLSAGNHRLRLRTAWTGGRRYFRALLVPAQSDRNAVGTLHPGQPEAPLEPTTGAKILSVGTLQTALPVMAGVKDGRDPLATYLRARWAVRFAPGDAADDSVLALLDVAPQYVGTFLVAGQVAERLGELGYLDPAVSRVRALESWKRGTRRHPEAPALELAYARALLDSGKFAEAVQRGRRLLQVESLPTLLFLADAYQRRGWWAQSLPVLERAQELAPQSCEVTARWLQARERLGDLADPADSGLDALADECLVIQRLIAASYPPDPSGSSPRELALIALLRRDPYDVRNRVELARAQWTTGRTDQALKTLEAGVEADPWATQVQLVWADLLRANGRTAEATTVLDRALTATPGDLRLLRARAWLDGELFMADQRAPLDDDLVFQAAETSKVVLDRRHVQVHPDGAATALVHRVVRVTNRQDAEAAGAITLPEGAIALQVRTRKQNGEVVDADTISGNQLLLRALGPGDVAEVEYLLHTPPRGEDGSFWPLVHAFGDPRWRVQRAEFTAVFPPGLAHTVTTSAACCSRETTTRSRRGTTRSWVMEALAPQRAERDSPDAAVWAPFVTVTSGDEIELRRRQLSGRAAISTRPTRRIRALAARIAPENDATQEAHARSIFNWVTRQVTRRSDDLSVPASSILTTNRGSPAVLTAALLRAAQIPAEIALIRPEPAPGPVSPEMFTSPVVRTVLDGKVVWLDPSLTYMPFAYLPPRLQNARVMALGLDGPRSEERTPALAAERERRRITETLRLEPTGEVRGEARLELSGETAAIVREQLSAKTSEIARRQVVETIAAAEFPGSTLTRFSIERAEERGVPLIVQFRFSLQVQPNRGRVTLRHRLAPQGLTARYGVSTRDTPLLIERGRRSTAKVTLIPPVGWTLVSATKTEDAAAPFGTLARTVERPGARWVIEDRFELDAQLVAREDIAAFREWSRKVDGLAVIDVVLVKSAEER